jgi:hemoglobin
MKRFVAVGICAFFCATHTFAADVAIPSGEEPVDPYTQSNENAGAKPLPDTRTFKAFHGIEGIARVVDKTVDLSVADPRMLDIFKGHDLVRLRRTLKEQFCYLLAGPCDYTGRDMKSSHKDMGLQTRDLNLLIEHLREAMQAEKISNSSQNRLLAMLAPMHRNVVER